MPTFQESLVTVMAVTAIALFFAGLVWRLYRGGAGDGDGRD
jgi:hypothetical protein